MAPQYLEPKEVIDKARTSLVDRHIAYRSPELAWSS